MWAAKLTSSQFTGRRSGGTPVRIYAYLIYRYDSATNVEYFKRHVEQAHRITNRDVWITEFGPHGSEDQKIDFLRDVLPWLDNQDYVFRYAMFMASPGELINNRGDGLSRLGQVYNTL